MTTPSRAVRAGTRLARRRPDPACTPLLVLHALLMAALVALAPATARAAEPADKPSAQASAASAIELPRPLTREAIRELVSRLSDEQVRSLLIGQLDRAAAPEPAPGAGMADMVRTISEADALRGRTLEVLRAGIALPEALAAVAARLAGDRGPGLWQVVALGFLAMVAAGALAEALIRWVARDTRRRLDAPAAEGLGAQAARLVLRVALRLAFVAAFAGGALGLFFALWQGYEPVRLLLVSLVAAIVGARVYAVLAGVLLEPRAPALRLLPLQDGTARTLFRGTVLFAALYALLEVVRLLMARFEAPEVARDALTLVASTLLLAILIALVWSIRADIARLLRGEGEPGSLRRLLADAWPGLVTAFLLITYGALATETLSGERRLGRAGIATVVLLLVLPLADMFLRRVVDALTLPAPGAGEEAMPALGASFRPVLHKAVHIVVVVLGLVALARLWRLDLFALAERGLGSRISSALLGIAITVLLAYILWEVAKTAIDRRMRSETYEVGVQAASRLRTLLPLLRMTLQITLLVMAVLSILAALGVNIVPLLAGAGVVGVAIGFGSQTLVRDIVSGAFFLMDDAFRLGEYIEVGDAKGVVEKITVRSVFLRHHRGAVNILPYGEIKRLRNVSRDWMIMTMEFRLELETDLKKVKQIFKRIGQELSEDPEMGPNLIEPLKSQGVREVDQDALIVRAKFMSKPGSAPFLIRREAYSRILKAFADAGIRLAHRHVTVYVPPGAPPEAAASAVAGAAAQAAEPEAPKAAG